MSILQFLRIIWARRLIVFAATFVAALSAILVAEIMPPRYQAQSRVMLDVIKPDPVTGQVMANAFIRAYTKTQIELIKDEKVASTVVKDLNWATNKRILREYSDRDRSDDRDFMTWATHKVIDDTEAEVIAGSNILEISYSNRDPLIAKTVADSLSKAYMDTSLQSRREAARRNAEWYGVQAEKAKTGLFQAEMEKAKFERENGILLQDNKVDLDSARLSALAAQNTMQVMTSSSAPVSAAAMQLTQLDSDIGQAEKTLGPNHPALLEMHRRRDLLAKQAAAERAAVGAGENSANAARATAGLLEAQKSRVMAQREKVERLRLLQDDIDLRREQYNRSAGRAAELRQEADVAETGVTPLGSAVTPQSPVFPNKPLIIFGGLAAGLGVGLVSAFALELLGRRVRSPEDLRMVTHVPVLAIVSRPHTRTGLHLRERLARVVRRSARPRVGAGRA